MNTKEGARVQKAVRNGVCRGKVPRTNYLITRFWWVRRTDVA